MTPLVSIIVPVYNVEKYLKQCVDSLINQTYQKIEILLIDDGSKDSSGKICDEFAREYSEITTYHKKNSGLGLTRNYGLDRLNGDYVTFVDSDDYLEKDAIKKLVMGLDNDQNDTVIGGFTKVTDSGKVLYTESYAEEIVNQGEVYSNLFVRMLGSSPSEHDFLKPSVWNTLYSVEIIREHKLYFVSERELISEDFVWNSDYYQYSKNVKIISSASYYYRCNPNSLTQVYKKDRFARSIAFYQYMIKKTSKTSVSEEAYLRLTKSLFIYVKMCFTQGLDRPFGQIKKEIAGICSDQILQKAISSYPVDKLGIKQRFFVMMIAHKKSTFLTCLAKLHLM